MAALEASAEAGKLAERIRRMEMEGGRGRVGMRGEAQDVNDRALLFERGVSGGQEGGGLGRGDEGFEKREEGNGGVLGRVNVFERGSSGGDGVGVDKVGVSGRAEAEEKADSRGGVLKKMGVFERESCGVRKDEDNGSGASLSKRAEEIKGSKSGSGKGATVSKKAGVFEKEDSVVRKESNVDGNDGSLLTKAAIFEKDVKKGKEDGEVGLSSKRTAVFEKGASKLVKKEEVKKCVEKSDEGGLVKELREVKVMNKVLVERLVELSGAFKRLEQSREELQQRIQRLEKK